MRRILNFGHTIGHALEALEEFRLPHGAAVAMGMLVESYISYKMGFLSESDFLEIEALIRSFPFKLEMRFDVQKMLSFLCLDKKAVKGVPRFVLLNRIGSCERFSGEYCSPVPKELLFEALEWMH